MTYRDGPPLPRPAHYAAFVQAIEPGASLYIVGGANADYSANYDTILAFEGSQWSELPTTLSLERHDAAAVLIGENRSGC